MNFAKLRIVPRALHSPKYVIQLGKNFSDGIVSVKPEELIDKQERKKPKVDKAPFAKNLFIGKFDVDVLTYPEVLDHEQLQNLNQIVAPIEHYNLTVDLDSIDEGPHLLKKKLEFLKSLHAFGLHIPTEYGGRGMNTTECGRIGEATSLDGRLALTLATHQAVCLKGILAAGTEEQKKQYLPRLATGELVAAFCFSEADLGADATSIKTEAVLSGDGETWILSGRKLWISCGDLTNLFTVFAKTKVEDERGDLKDTTTAFIVEANFAGISSRKPEDKLGIQASHTYEVIFDNTPVPAKNVLGVAGDGLKIAANILNSTRLSFGSSYTGFLKHLIKTTVEQATNRKQFGKPYIEFGLIQEKFAKLTCMTYALESMTYLTAGMLDTYKEPDCEIEAAIVKVFSTEALRYGASECLEILGGLGSAKDYPYECILRDAKTAMILEGSSEMLRLLISLVGLQHAGLNLNESVKKLRNPALNPLYVIYKMWDRRKHESDNPKLTLGLDGYLHPSLQNAAQMLEYCVLRLQYIVEVVLARHGANVAEYHMELRRLADIAIYIYAMTAALGRSSRSYCIGLRHAEAEVILAATFCHDAHSRVKTAVRELELAPFVNNDTSYVKVSESVFQHKEYFPVSPLTRNF